MLNITIEFGGGAELLFENIKKHQATLPHCDKSWSIRRLLVWIKDNLLKERPELFIQGETVRPGILVLVNDSDWELLLPRIGPTKILHPKTAPAQQGHHRPLRCSLRTAFLKAPTPAMHYLFAHDVLPVDFTQGQLDYELQENDNVLFISTLHGG